MLVTGAAWSTGADRAMRLVLGILLLIFSCSVSWSTDALPSVLGDDDVTVNYRNGTYFASLSFPVQAVPAVVLAVLTDFDHMSAFIPNLTESRVIARAGNTYRIRQQGKAKFGPFSFPFESERQIEWFPDGRLVAQAVSGSSKFMRSEMRYQATADGTRIDYQLEVIPDRWLPSSIGVSFMRHELAEQFSALAREMARRQKA